MNIDNIILIDKIVINRKIAHIYLFILYIFAIVNF